MKNKTKTIVMMLLLAGQAAMGQQKPLSLKEAIELSISNNKQLKIGAAKVDEAYAILKQSEQRQLPDVTASTSYLRLSSANIDMKKQNTSSSNNGPSPVINQAALGMLNATLPVYAGGRIKYGIESSRYLAQASKLDAQNDKEAIIENTVEAYINLYKAKAAVDLVNENLSQSQQRDKDLAGMEKNGLLSRNDLLKAELQTSNTELALLDVENNYQLANLNMNLMLGLPEKTVLIPDTTLLMQKFNVQNIEEYVQSALNNRKDVAAHDLRKQAAALGVKSVKSEYYPSLQLKGGYVAANIPHLLTVTNAMNIGVGISYNLGSLWNTKAKVQEAESKVKQMVFAEDLMQDNIRLQVNKAFLNWQSSQKKIEIYEKAIEQAKENYRIVKNKYNNALATTTDVLDADVAQLQARLNYVFAKADAVVAYNQLLQTAGMIDQQVK